MNEHFTQTPTPDIAFEPLVSIVITSYNRAHYIEEAIRSALAQDYRNLEIIISDNCSTDGSSEIFKKY
ncbi:MAG: glycosyltransferase, partial [Bacteroidetes bacterium]|nr:glycosyltransferase [Bacteroidota bacterium]